MQHGVSHAGTNRHWPRRAGQYCRHRAPPSSNIEQGESALPLMPSPSTESTAVLRSAVVLAGGGAIVVVVLPSGLALIATESRCNSNPDGDTLNSKWTFSGYCKALAFHPYVGPVNFAGGLLPGIFGPPVLAVFIATCFAISVRRLTPIKWGLYVGVALIVCLFAADVGFADATFHGCC